MDGSAADAWAVGKTAISLGLRHIAMSLETSRRAAAAEIWHVGICGDAKCLDLSDHLSADLAGDGFAAGLHLLIDFGRPHSAALGLHIYEPEAGPLLLRTVSRSRLECRLFRVCARAQGTLAAAVVVVPAKVLLSPGDVLRNDQVGRDCL